MSSITSDIPREIEELLINIKYIAALPPGHKYDIGSQNYVSATSIVSKAYRTTANLIFTNEDKVGALNFINRTITAAIQLSRKHPKWQQLICQEISLLTDTIANLKHVYSSEPKFVAQLSTVELKIQPDAFNNACLAPDPIPSASVPIPMTPVPSPASSPPASVSPTNPVLATVPVLPPMPPPGPIPVLPPMPVPAPTAPSILPPATPSPDPPAIFFMERSLPDNLEEAIPEEKTEKIDSSTQSRVKGSDRDGRRAGKKGGDRSEIGSASHARAAAAGDNSSA